MRPAFLALGAALTLTLSGCGSSHESSVEARYSSVPQAASRISRDCAPKDQPSSDADALLWLRGGGRPFVYYRNGAFAGPRVYSSQGRVYRLYGVFWPCNPPVIIYGRPRTGETLMTVLTSGHGRLKTQPLGRLRLASGPTRDSLAGYGNAIIGADGRLIFFDGTKIRYAGGAEFSPPGLQHGWEISGLAVSPHDSSLSLASVETRPGPEGCRGDVHGAIFLISPSRSTKLRSYDACSSPVTVQWSPDGRTILWSLVGPQRLFVSDSQGATLTSSCRAT